MKKFVVVLLVLALAVTGCVAFVGCKSNDGDVVKVIDIPLTEEMYGFGVNLESTELLASVNAYLQKIKGDGSLQAIFDKYEAIEEGSVAGLTAVTSAASKTGALVVATNAEFAPFEYKDGDNYYGIDLEIAKGLAAYLDKPLYIDNMDFDAVVTSVQLGNADIAMAGLTINTERAELIAFSSPYYTEAGSIGQVVITLADDTTFDACITKEDVMAILNATSSTDKIGVQNGTTAQYFVDGSAGWDFDGLPADSVGYNSGALAVQALINGNVKYVIIDCAPAKVIVANINKVN